MYNKACHVLLTPHEYGITVEEIIKEQKEVKIYVHRLLDTMNFEKPLIHDPQVQSH